MTFDLSQHGRFQSERTIPATDRTRTPRQVGLFVRGPIPWYWLQAAAKHRGRGLHVAIAIMLEAGMAGDNARLGKEWFMLRKFAVRDLDVDRSAESRALKQLEARGLIRVDRRRGRRPRILVVPCRDAPTLPILTDALAPLFLEPSRCGPDQPNTVQLQARAEVIVAPDEKRFMRAKVELIFPDDATPTRATVLEEPVRDSRGQATFTISDIGASQASLVGGAIAAPEILLLVLRSERAVWALTCHYVRAVADHILRRGSVPGFTQTKAGLQLSIGSGPSPYAVTTAILIDESGDGP